MRNFGLSFKFAFEGLVYLIRTQRNARIHALVSLSVIAMGIWLQIEALEWAALVLAMIIVWVAEIINTSLEALVDLVSPERRQQAKAAKDTAAAAVLVTATGAVIVGLLVLGPPLVAKIF